MISLDQWDEINTFEANNDEPSKDLIERVRLLTLCRDHWKESFRTIETKHRAVGEALSRLGPLEHSTYADAVNALVDEVQRLRGNDPSPVVKAMATARPYIPRGSSAATAFVLLGAAKAAYAITHVQPDGKPANEDVERVMRTAIEAAAATLGSPPS
jgi:hypothetical protein